MRTSPSNWYIFFPNLVESRPLMGLQEAFYKKNKQILVVLNGIVAQAKKFVDFDFEIKIIH